MKKNIKYIITCFALIMCTFIMLNVTIVKANVVSKKFDGLTDVQIKQNGEYIKIWAIPAIKTKEDLENYKVKADNNLKKLNKDELDKGSFLATITLKKAITLDEFKNFISAYKLDINDYTIRAFSKTGERVTIGGVLSKESTIPEDKLKIYYADNTVEGIISFTCNINNNNFASLKELQRNEFVYLVDVNGYFIEKQMKEELNKNLLRSTKIPNVYWYIEDYKIFD